MKFLILFILLATNFAYSQTVYEEFDTIEQKKKALEGAIDRVPYKEEQYTIIEDYFSYLSEFALEVKNFTRTTNNYNNAVSDISVKTFCSKVFIDKKRYGDLIKNCTKNRFFLCAEEVKGFEDAKKLLRDMLKEETKRSFISTARCENVP